MKSWRRTSVREILGWHLLRSLPIRHIPEQFHYQVGVGIYMKYYPNPLTEVTLPIFYQGIELLQDLERENLCHGDIKPEHLRLDGTELKIIDFETVSYNGSFSDRYSPCYTLDERKCTFTNDRFAMWLSFVWIQLEKYGFNPYLYDPHIPDGQHQILLLIKGKNPHLSELLQQLLNGVSYREILIGKVSSPFMRSLSFRDLPNQKHLSVKFPLIFTNQWIASEQHLIFCNPTIKIVPHNSNIA